MYDNKESVKNLNVDEVKKHIVRLHNESHGYITIASKNNGLYKQRHYMEKELKEKAEEIIEADNSYISQNTFYFIERKIEYIKQLRALYIDIDVYNTKYTKEGVIYFLENDIHGKIPKPNFIIDSGRGLYYIILIDAVPSMALPLWYAVQRYLYNNLKEYGADPKALDPTRVLRIPGTINSKSGSEVKVLEYYDYIYTLREIQESYLPDLIEGEKKKAGRPKKIVHIYNEYTLYHARLLDIVKLCELRNYDVKGYREMILFLYRYYNCVFLQDEEKALNDALELNNKFKEPLSVREVEIDTRSAERCYKETRYKYTNKVLIELLEITDIEQRELKTIIGTREKYRRNNEKRNKIRKQHRRNEYGQTKRESKKVNKIKAVKKLYNEGYKQKDIAKNLNITKSTVSKYLKLKV